jgi:competence protein ComEC
MKGRFFMRKCHSLFKLAFPVLVHLMVCCGTAPRSADEPFDFAVLDVGQGLSQIGVSGGRAIVWDMGLDSAFPLWQAGYARLGSPAIMAIAISHTDGDHAGGLGMLPLSIDFTGVVIVHPHLDTAALRAAAGQWRTKAVFCVRSAGDTLGGLDGVIIHCLWPPREFERPAGATDDQYRNRASFCFRIVHGSNSAFISSDIDTAAERALSRRYGYGLQSEILVVPHHGSRGSVDPAFFGFIRTQEAIISCSLPNEYGHPAPEMIELLASMGARIRITADDGDVVLRSNGMYWCD